MMSQSRRGRVIPGWTEILSRALTSRRPTGGHQPGGKYTSCTQRRSSAWCELLEGEASQLQTFQSLTSQPDHGREFGTAQGFRHRAEGRRC
ncbi:uncharacterized protein ACO6RY_09930 [Pungitius sinensis]